MSDDLEARPNSFPLPPVLAVALIAIGIAARAFAPDLALLFTAPAPVKLAGAALVVLALALDFWTFATFRHHRTNVMPTRPALALVTGGPFSFSRNPIYLGNVLLIAGVGLYTGVGLLLILALANGLILDRTQIRREEGHLAARFGDEWQAYRARVRRWL